MREIKFRGKRIDNGEWAYGYYLSFVVDVYSCGEIIGTKDEHYIITPCHEDFNYEHTFEVDPETVGQYTGFKDKNGVEIYEGFILKWEKQETETDEYMSQTDEVVFKDGAFMLRNIEGWCPVYQHFDEYFDNLGDGESVTVIGNVYDNPELVGE